MAINSIGDLSTPFLFQRQNTALKTQLQDLTTTLSSGRHQNLAEQVSGDFSALSQIEHDLKLLDSYANSIARAELQFSAMQSSLSRVGDAVGTAGEAMLLAGTSADAISLRTSGATAEAAFRDAVASLNVQISGRTLFSGAAVHTPALADADVFLDELKTAVSGISDPDAVLDAVETWFTTPGTGFDALGYLGADQPSGPQRVSETQSIATDLKADDPDIVATLKTLASAALLADETLMGGDVDRRAAMAAKLGADLVAAQQTVAGIQGELGASEARLETISTQNIARATLLSTARNDLQSADPYDTAAQLQQVQLQLELHYTLTARLSRLNLADYL